MMEKAEKPGKNPPRPKWLLDIGTQTISNVLAWAICGILGFAVLAVVGLVKGINIGAVLGSVMGFDFVLPFWLVGLLAILFIGVLLRLSALKWHHRKIQASLTRATELADILREENKDLQRKLTDSRARADDTIYSLQQRLKEVEKELLAAQKATQKAEKAPASTPKQSYNKDSIYGMTWRWDPLIINSSLKAYCPKCDRALKHTEFRGVVHFQCIVCETIASIEGNSYKSVVDNVLIEIDHRIRIGVWKNAIATARATQETKSP